MQEQLQQRLNKLQEEFSNGQRLSADLASQQSQLKESLLRISGAIQVLEEILAKECNGGDTNIMPMDASVERKAV